jgi:hypothetical protein
LNSRSFCNSVEIFVALRWGANALEEHAEFLHAKFLSALIAEQPDFDSGRSGCGDEEAGDAGSHSAVWQ